MEGCVQWDSTGGGSNPGSLDQLDSAEPTELPGLLLFSLGNRSGDHSGKPVKPRTFILQKPSNYRKVSIKRHIGGDNQPSGHLVPN